MAAGRSSRQWMCYLRSGGARAAAVTAGDAAFSAIQAEWTALVPAVLPYRPGELFLRELPPLHAVLAQVRGLGVLGHRRLRRS